MGIMLIYYQTSQPDSNSWSSVALNFNYPFFTISLSLNVLLTLMIVTRLVLHIRDTRNDTEIQAGGLRWCLIVLIESCALYAVTFILFIVPWGAKSRIADIFFPILAEAQVRTVLSFPRSLEIYYHLIVVMNRPFPRSSSFYESPTGVQ